MEAQQSHISTQGNQPPVPVFLATSVVIFFLSLSSADSVGFVPYYLDGSPASVSMSDPSVSLASLPELGDAPENAPASVAAVSTASHPVSPTRIKIPVINLDLPVQNTASHDVDVLDQVLEKGPVRYVDSAQLNDPGNMLVFAHSSHLPIVHNKMYQAFNHISELKTGDSITVEGADGRSYIYSVSSVRQTKADEEVISLSKAQGTKLTLSTCDTLTSKASRFVVEADFVGVVGE